MGVLVFPIPLKQFPMTYNRSMKKKRDGEDLKVLDPPFQRLSGAAKKSDVRRRNQHSDNGFKRADNQGHQKTLFKHLCGQAVIFPPECLGD